MQTGLLPDAVGFASTIDATVAAGPNPDLRAGPIQSTDDDVTLTSPASIVDAPVGSAIPPAAGDDGADVIGVNITLTANGGSIGQDNNFLEIDSSVDRFGVLTASATGVVRITETAGDSSAGYAHPGDLNVNAVTTCYGSSAASCADVSLATRNGSLLDGHNNGAGGTTVNVTGTASTCSPSAAASAPSPTRPPACSPATSSSTRQPEPDAEHLHPELVPGIRRRPRGHRHLPHRRAGRSEHLPHRTRRPANVLLAHALNGDVRITTTETTTEGNDILLLHRGTTLVIENSTQNVPNGLIEADSGNVLLLAADDVVTDPSGQVLATTAAGDLGTGNSNDPNQPTTTTGNIDIHGDWHPGVPDATANDGTVMVLRGELTPGTGGLTRVFGNADDDLIVFDQTLLAGQTRAFGFATPTAYKGFAPAGDGEDTVTVYLLQTMPTTATLSLDGQADTDHYIVWTHGSDHGDAHYVINVLDSSMPADGVDTLAIYGADSTRNGIDPVTGLPDSTDDIFLLRSTSYLPGESAARPDVYGSYAPAYVAVLHPETDPSADPLTVAQTSGYAGVVERINYDRGLNGMLSVLGLGGNDHFAVDGNAATTHPRRRRRQRHLPDRPDVRDAPGCRLQRTVAPPTTSRPSPRPADTSPREPAHRWSPRAAAATTASPSTPTTPRCASRATRATTCSSFRPSPSRTPPPTAP